MNDFECLKIIVSGKVQGVFFRQSTHKLANDLKLMGYVKNLATGDVEILVYGSTDNITRLLSFVNIGPPSAYVFRLRLSVADGKSFDYTDFRIES